MGKIERSKEFAEINAKLPSLDRGELEALRTRISAILHLSAGDPDVTSSGGEASRDDAMFALACIADTLAGLGEEFPHVGILQKSKGMPAFRAKVPTVMEFLRRSIKGRREQQAVLCIAIDLLYKAIGSTGLPISSRAVMNHFHRIPSILNQAFPGYASAGLLGLIIIRDARQKEHASVRPQRSDAPVSPPRRRSVGRR